MKYKNILAIDPGLRALGFAVTGSRGQLRHVEVFTTPPKLSIASTLRRVSTRLDDILKLYEPDVLLIESTWPNENQTLAQVHRVAQRCIAIASKKHGLPAVSLPALTVRRKLTGSGWSGKYEVARAVVSRYPELQIYLRQDRTWKERHFQNLFDALALIISEREAGRL